MNIGINPSYRSSDFVAVDPVVAGYVSLTRLFCNLNNEVVELSKRVRFLELREASLSMRAEREEAERFLAGREERGDEIGAEKMRQRIAELNSWAAEEKDPEATYVRLPRS